MTDLPAWPAIAAIAAVIALLGATLGILAVVADIAGNHKLYQRLMDYAVPTVLIAFPFIVIGAFGWWAIAALAALAAFGWAVHPRKKRQP